jgi:hypothetical protein
MSPTRNTEFGRHKPLDDRECYLPLPIKERPIFLVVFNAHSLVFVQRVKRRPENDRSATTADSGYHSAVQAIESAIQAAWTAAVNAEYPNAPDAAAYIVARIAYDNSVLTAWAVADTAAVALDNANADAKVAASNAALTAESNAAHAADKAGVEAQVQAMIAATDTQRDYDTSYVDTAVKDAKDTAEKTRKNAEDTATAKQKENDKQAGAYLDAITKADALHKTTVLQADDDIQQAADDFLKTSFASAKALQQQAETNANKADDDAIADATADGTAPKDRLIAHTKSETARLKAAALKSFDDAIANAQKQLADLHSGPTSNLNPYQMTASNGSIPFGNLTMMVLGIDGVRSNLKQVATGILSNLAMAGTMMGSALINTTPGTDAAGLMQQLLGMTNLRVTIISNSGITVGSYDLLSDAVYRAVTQADGSAKMRLLSKADVDAQLGSGMTADGWNQFFGGVNGTPDPKTLMHRAINWVIDDAKLQAPGGLASDIMLTAQVVTEVTGVIDPTGLSDAVNGSICLVQGDKDRSINK